MDYTKLNEQAWDRNAEEGDLWTRPITPAQFQEARSGKLELYLTPARPVPADWFPALTGCSVLGLASGGGQQGPILTAHGAIVTIMDLSERQLETERMVAEREGYEITIIKGDMTHPFPFADEAFDLIVFPVANCYIENIQHVWDECSRVLRPGGILMAGFCKEELFMFEFGWACEPPIVVKHPLPYNPLAGNHEELAAQGEKVVFSHTLEEQIGGQLQAGFELTGIYDDRDRDGVFARYMNTYAATSAVKRRNRK